MSSFGQPLIQELFRRQVPLVVGEIPNGSRAEAFVLPISYKMTVDVLKVANDTTHKNILFLQPNATKDIIVHEFQHWSDY